MSSATRRPTRRNVLKTAVAAAAVAALPRRPFAAETTGKRFIVNDASRLNPTPVYRHWIVGSDEQSFFIERLRRELKDAAAAKRPVAVAAARHTMGGQSLPRDGTAITMQTFRCEPDTRAKTYVTDAGTRWHQVISTLDPLGFSPAVMQSNADFGVASTFCVNAHGWPVPYGPFGSTVRAFKLMLADGTILTCSRTENSELFGLAMGGYGYFGIILELEVDMVRNLLLKPTFEPMPAEAFASKFTEAIDGDTGVKMAYGRLNVDRERFFREALMITYRALPTPEDGLPKATTNSSLSSLSRDLYRAQVGSELAKRVRWFAETVAGPAVSSGIATRNSLMNEPVSNLASSDRSRTDILHEYFVPVDRFPEFLETCREIIPGKMTEFLNVTLRYVGADGTSVMAYAPERRIAAVMSFSQAITPEGEAEMLQLTEAMIDRMIAIGGCFYLPYRLHARRDQVERAYCNTARFVEKKLHYDPGLLFRNAMWQAYFAP
jgi:FAD/FMN-containing dehydrogenase